MTDGSFIPTGRASGWTLLVGLTALGIISLSACRRPPTVSEEDGGLADPFSCTGWTKIATTPFPNTYRGIWGSSPTDVYLVLRNLTLPHPSKPTSSEIQHYDGKTVTTLSTGSTPSLGSPYDGIPVGIWGSSASNVYLALSEGLLHFDGSTWSKVAGVPNFSIRNVWGTGPNDVYAVGDGRVVHFDGTNWSTVLDDAAYRFNSVWCSGSDDVFVAAQMQHSPYDGAVYHFDGQTWSISLSSPFSVFSAVWGTGPSNVLAAGFRGGASFIYRFDGQAWSKEALPWHETTIGQLGPVWGHSASRIFAGGMYTLLGWDGQRWKPINIPSSSYLDIQGFWGSGTTLFVAANEWGGVGAVWRATCEP